MNRFDKPHRILPTINKDNNIELFNLVSKLDTHEILQFSLINQVPLDVENNMGESLIHVVINIDSKKASEHAKLNVIKFLVLNNVDPDKPNNNNQTPLHHACILQLELIVNYLLKLEVDVNYKDNLGNTPLHYLLTGKIKTIDNTSEVFDFVPPPKKVDTKLRDLTIDLKKSIWELIDEKSSAKPSIDIKEYLPMLETIKNTIDNIFIEESEIAKKKIDTKNLIAKLTSQVDSEDKLPEIKNHIQSNRKFITDKIKGLMGDLKDLENIKIHDNNETSWSPISGNESLITEGKIKKIIKKKITDQKDITNKLANDFIVIEDVKDELYSILYKQYIFKIGI